MNPVHVFYVVLICACVLAMLGLLLWSVGELECPPVDDRDETDEAGA